MSGETVRYAVANGGYLTHILRPPAYFKAVCGFYPGRGNLPHTQGIILHRDHWKWFSDSGYRHCEKCFAQIGVLKV